MINCKEKLMLLVKCTADSQMEGVTDTLDSYTDTEEYSTPQIHMETSPSQCHGRVISSAFGLSQQTDNAI